MVKFVAMLSEALDDPNPRTKENVSDEALSYLHAEHERVARDLSEWAEALEMASSDAIDLALAQGSETQRRRVLLAEDDPVSRQVVERYLGRWGYECVSVTNGQEALEVLEEDNELSILITDWMMPELDGLGLTKHVRQLERESYLYVMMLTAKSNRDDLLDGMRAGADAFLTKPIDAPEVLAQLRVAERVLELEEELAEQLGEVTLAHRRIKAELAAAARVQQSRLPKSAPHFPGVEFSWIFDSCDEVAGDMLNVLPLDDHRVAIYILDVAGHGVKAAFLSVTLSDVLRPPAKGSGVMLHESADGTRKFNDPAEVARLLNLRFPMSNELNQFFTLVYGIYDTRDRTFTYVRAGHTEPVIIRDGAAVPHDAEVGPAIGIIEEMEFQNSRLELQPGDKLLLYTDGLVEAQAPDQSEYGERRLFDFLSANADEPVDRLVRAVHADVEAFTEDRDQHDDVTLLGFAIEPTGAPKTDSTTNASTTTASAGES
ncbi:MAG: SpoIIE family protein phosphatase [Planctomycetota bacterium]